MDAILTPYPEDNTTILELYESLYYDNVDNSITFGSGSVTFGSDRDQAFDFVLEPRNLFPSEDTQELPFLIGDLIAEISSCYPTASLKEITYKVGGIYCNNAETMESFVPGQRVGEYEYIAQETDTAVFLFGRKQSGDEYVTIHYWLK